MQSYQLVTKRISWYRNSLGGKSGGKLSLINATKRWELSKIIT